MSELRERCGGKPGAPEEIYPMHFNDEVYTKDYTPHLCFGCHDCDPDKWCACGKELCELPCNLMRHYRGMVPHHTDVTSFTDACHASQPKPDPTYKCACLEYYGRHHPECPTGKGKPQPKPADGLEGWLRDLCELPERKGDDPEFLGPFVPCEDCNGCKAAHLIRLQRDAIGELVKLVEELFGQPISTLAGSVDKAKARLAVVNACIKEITDGRS